MDLRRGNISSIGDKNKDLESLLFVKDIPSISEHSRSCHRSEGQTDSIDRVDWKKPIEAPLEENTQPRAALNDNVAFADDETVGVS